jgi:hypothetical protein
MTTIPRPAGDTGAPARLPQGAGADRRAFWLPTGGMIATRLMDLRKRRGLMIVLMVVNIGLPSTYLLIRLIEHAVDPTTYGPAGGFNVYSTLTAGVMYVFGFIAAAALGCTAGSIDLTEGMFRHLVITGRSRIALYLARIPAGLAIIVPLVAIGFTIVCAVCVLAAPKQISYGAVSVPAGLSRSGLQQWASQHPNQVICSFPSNRPIAASVPCSNGSNTGVAAGSAEASAKTQAVEIARENYPGYSHVFLAPPISLMIKTGLWLELEAIIGFIVGLGLASLLGQRTIGLIVMIIVEIILTPILATHTIPHLINLQRAVVGVATAHLEPAGLSLVYGGGGGGPDGGRALLVPESTTLAIIIILAWVVGWTALGAWRMTTRDA